VGGSSYDTLLSALAVSIVGLDHSHNLLDRLDGRRDEVLRYAEDLRVPFTNTNGSERDIRPLKIRLKVAGCLRTMAGAEAFCRLRSYLSTARKQGQSAFGVLRLLHEGNPWMPVTVR
jgi:transposase